MINTEKTFRIAGVGGQGIVLAGYILGRAASIFEKKYSVFTQQYGPAARGTNCYSSVIVADEPIVYPVIDHASVYVCMSDKAYTADSTCTITPETMFFADASAEQTVAGIGEKAYCVDASHEARKLGTRMVANMVMLGYVTAVSGIISKDAMIESIRTAVNTKYIDINLTAFDRGYSLHTGL